MKQLMNLRLFSSLSETSKDKGSLIELEDAYEEFAFELLGKLQTETNLASLYYNLGYARLELAEVRNNLPDGQGGKCFKHNK